MNNLAPIVLFVYNRPWHTQQTIEALQKNELSSQSELFVYSDEAKNDDVRESVDEVRAYIDKINGFKKVTVIKRDKNWGLADSIIDGVTKVVNEYGKIIVLEDDLVTSPYFLKFMNESLEMYKNDEGVASIQGYIYPIDELPQTFFIRGADCWGWATWQRAWNVFESSGAKLLSELQERQLEYEADFNGEYGYTKMLKDQIRGNNSSWAVRWYMSAFLKGMVTLYSGKSYIQNIGLDNTGRHCGATTTFDVTLIESYEKSLKIALCEDKNSREKIKRYLKSIKLNLPVQIKTKIKELLKI